MGLDPLFNIVYADVNINYKKVQNIRPSVLGWGLSPGLHLFCLRGFARPHHVVYMVLPGLFYLPRGPGTGLDRAKRSSSRLDIGGPRSRAGLSRPYEALGSDSVVI